MMYSPLQAMMVGTKRNESREISFHDVIVNERF
jgi:hypothetical protein